MLVLLVGGVSDSPSGPVAPQRVQSFSVFLRGAACPVQGGGSTLMGIRSSGSAKPSPPSTMRTFRVLSSSSIGREPRSAERALVGGAELGRSGVEMWNVLGWPLGMKCWVGLPIEMGLGELGGEVSVPRRPLFVGGGLYCLWVSSLSWSGTELDRGSGVGHDWIIPVTGGKTKGAWVTCSSGGEGDARRVGALGEIAGGVGSIRSPSVGSSIGTLSAVSAVGVALVPGVAGVGDVRSMAGCWWWSNGGVSGGGSGGGWSVGGGGSC